KDPTFALGYVGLANCYWELGALRLVAPGDAYLRGKEVIRKALDLDESSSEAHSELAFMIWQFDWDWQAAEKEFRRSIELNPNSIDSHESLSWFLAWSGRYDEALAQLRKLRYLDPAYPFSFIDEAGIYYHKRDYSSMLEASRQAVAFAPNGWI